VLVIRTGLERSSSLTNVEIRRAREAARIMQSLETPSLATVKQLVLRHCDNLSGSSKLLPIDFDRADALYSRPEVGAGKSVTRPTGSLPEDTTFYEDHKKRPQTCHSDLIFVQGKVYLLSVFTPLFHTQIDEVTTRETSSILPALRTHLTRMTALRVPVHRVMFDGEGALEDTDEAERYLGLEVRKRPAGAHVCVAERRARTVKERVRAALYRIKFKVSRSLITELLKAVVDRMNWEPVSQRPDHTPSNEVLKGRKLDLMTEACFTFGDFVQTMIPNVAKNSATTVRIQRGIALRPCADGWYIKLIDSWETVTRKNGDTHRDEFPTDVKVALDKRRDAEYLAWTAEVDAVKLAKQKGRKLGKKQQLAVLEEGWVIGGIVVPDDELGEAPSLPNFEFDSTTLDALGIGSRFMSAEDTSTIPDGATGETPQERVPIMSGVEASGLEFGEGAKASEPLQKEGAVSTSATEATTGKPRWSMTEGSSSAPSAGIGSIAPPAPKGRLERQGTSVESQDSGRVSPKDSNERESRENPLTQPEASSAGEKSSISESPISNVHPSDASSEGQGIRIWTGRERRAARRQLGREYGKLLDKIARFEKPAVASRTSSRTTKGKRRKINSAKIDAFVREHGEQVTRDAIVEELTNWVDNRVFKAVHMHMLTDEQRRKILRTTLVLKAKYTPTGAFDKIKARIVAGGDMEDKTTFDNLYSPTTSMEAALATLAIAAFENRIAKVLDITAAFLEVEVIEGSETYVRLNPLETSLLVGKYPIYKKYVDDRGCFIGRLSRSLYGLCQSSGNLFREISRFLIDELGFVANPKDVCSFARVRDGVQTSLVLFIDDILMTSVSESHLNIFIEEFKRRFPKVTVKCGDTLPYLGMLLHFERSFSGSGGGKCTVSMPAYCDKIEELWTRVHNNAKLVDPNIKGNAFISTDIPASPDLFEQDEDSPLLHQPQSDDFHSIVATILFMAKRARPELLCATSYLTTKVKAPTVQDWRKLRKLVSFIAGTKDKGLVLQPKGIWVEAWADAAYGIHQADRRSHSGTIVSIGGAPIYFSSKRQGLTAKSAAEAEIICVSDAATMITWAQHFLALQGYGQLPAARLWEDSASTIFNLKRGAPTALGSRHYEIRYFYMSDLEKRGVVEVKHLNTKEMTADLLTKGLPLNLFSSLAEKLTNSYSDAYAEDPNHGSQVTFRPNSDRR
jgi:hypothetical protein